MVFSSAIRRARLPVIAALFLALVGIAIICTHLVNSRSREEPAKQVMALEPPPVSSKARTPSPGAARVPGDLPAAGHRGDLPAQARLCSESMTQAEITGDHRDSAYWCALAARAGDASSQAAYARLFQLGVGVAQDEVQAAFWYDRAIDQQDAYAMYMRARMLLSGDSPPDQALGLTLLRRSAAMGNANARWMLRDLGETPEARRERPLLR